MDLDNFFREMPKIELHAHLNGSLSRSTMLSLQRCLADLGIKDQKNAFLNEFQMSSGDSKTLPDTFPLFAIAHELTSVPESLAMATEMTLREFKEDGCCYIELRSTPRETPHMTHRQYVETIVQTMRSEKFLIIPCLIISLNRSSPNDVDMITDLAIEYHRKYPETVVGIELSGNPAVGKFAHFLPALTRAREAGLKITLHCGEIPNIEEIREMLKFRPDRIGHGVCIHPNYGGNEEIWQLLLESKIPVEICLTSNVNTKSIPNYSLHHFKELYNARVPVVLGTDDKGIFSTSLSQEYRICSETFGLDPSKLVRLSLRTCDYMFLDEKKKTICDMILNFINKNVL